MNVVENIINNQDDIIDYVQKNVDREEVGKFVDSVISSKEEMENSTEIILFMLRVVKIIPLIIKQMKI